MTAHTHADIDSLLLPAAIMRDVHHADCGVTFRSGDCACCMARLFRGWPFSAWDRTAVLVHGWRWLCVVHVRGGGADRCLRKGWAIGGRGDRELLVVTFLLVALETSKKMCCVLRTLLQP